MLINCEESDIGAFNESVAANTVGPTPSGASDLLPPCGAELFGALCGATGFAVPSGVVRIGKSGAFEGGTLPNSRWAAIVLSI